jgi:transcriptional regulator with XRE-family HTH domain
MSGQAQRSPLNTSLRELRKQRGWTQAEVAEALGVTDLTVRRWELGQTIPSAYHMKKLCDLFEKSPEELGLLQQRQPSRACSKVLVISPPHFKVEPRRYMQREE